MKRSNDDYTVVLLAAGYGSRISALTDNPKCLLSLKGQTLLERNLMIWKSLGLRKIHLVLGHKKETIRPLVLRYKGEFDFSFFINQDYRNYGNTFSLYLGIKDLLGPCLIFDADLVYDQKILECFLKDQKENQILVGKADLSDIECSKALVDNNGSVVKLVDKRAVTDEELKHDHFAGEAIGILKFSRNHLKKLKNLAAQFLAKKENINLNWEYLINEFLKFNKVNIHNIKSGRWIEIDTPEDFQEAQQIFQ